MSAIVSNLIQFATWAVSSLIDALFLISWVYVQFWTNRLISGLELTGVDQIVFWVFQITFAVSTVMPILLYVYKDTYKMYFQMKHELNHFRRNLSS